jgi:hypothetical protein
MPSMTPVVAGSGTAVTAVTDQAPLVCSETLVCSDELDCADNGAVAATTSTGTMVAA